MCWRPHTEVKKRSKLCSKHNACDRPLEYKRRRRRLEKLATLKNFKVETNQIVRRLCTEIKSPEKLYKELTLNSHCDDWLFISREIMKSLEKHYTHAHSSTVTLTIERCTSILKWVELLIRRFDKDAPNDIYNDYVALSEKASTAEQIRCMLHLFARIEVEKKFKLEEQVRRGPSPGSVNFNTSLYAELIQLITENEELGTTIRTSKIAKKFNISRQTVHEKLNRIKENKKHYRKEINRVNKLKKQT